MSEPTESELKEETKEETFPIAFRIAKKILSGETISEEEKEILKPIHARVAMAIAAKEACKGVAGVETVKSRRWDKKLKEFGPEIDRQVNRFSQCVGYNMIEIDYKLRKAIKE